ncbi:hypothetical protein [Tropicimonas sp. IMCC6043]|uniref:hypothetical protein n=1 Tax=Tropicimonas sp. IMCC6043 TaxID=2510645 RepID=UPI00101CA0BE|nr:hypothetical protein [Tropicimonas sp. IMCC6043]RYH09778.1 hypothetical protein EU800_11090 [Tropicimonas sp. IMCC6043]
MKYGTVFVLSLSTLLASPAIARADVAQDVVARLTSEGYTLIHVHHNMWQTRIRAHRGDELRVIALFERTGEIFRDERQSTYGDVDRQHRAAYGGDQDTANDADRDRDRDRDGSCDLDGEPDQDRTRDRDHDGDKGNTGTES